MSWLKLLFNVSYAVTVIAGITVLFKVVPAYKRTKHRAFLYLACAFMLGVFDTICDHTIGLWHMSFQEYVPYRTLRRFTYFADVIFLAMGVISLTRSYLVAVGKSEDEKQPSNRAHVVRGILLRPLFWIGIILLLIPTAWFAIDMYSLPQEARSTSADHARTAHAAVTIVMSYIPGLACFIAAILPRPKHTQ